MLKLENIYDLYYKNQLLEIDKNSPANIRIFRMDKDIKRGHKKKKFK